LPNKTNIPPYFFDRRFTVLNEKVNSNRDFRVNCDTYRLEHEHLPIP